MYGTSSYEIYSSFLHTSILANLGVVCILIITLLLYSDTTAIGWNVHVYAHVYTSTYMYVNTSTSDLLLCALAQGNGEEMTVIHTYVNEHPGSDSRPRCECRVRFCCVCALVLCVYTCMYAMAGL